MTAYIASRPDGKICLIGAPFDSTSTFNPGARFGPGAIRVASHGLETFSPQQQADLEDCPFMDKGDLELPFGDPQAALSMVEGSIKEIHLQGRLPFLLGGEHLVSLGAVAASATAYKDLKIISPYNTYNVTGLPPGPICSPGKDSIISAVDLIIDSLSTKATLVVLSNRSKMPSVVGCFLQSTIRLCICINVVETEIAVVKISILGRTVLTSGP